MAVLDDLLAFSMDREPWQQDAIRRLFTQAELSETDFDDAYLMLKAWHKLIDPAAAPVATSLQATHPAHCGTRASGTIINSIGNLENCNRLANNQKLRFAVAGVTLIYGDNGCGKSGYCRVLKKVCRVREGADEPILGDAYTAATHPPAKATIRYSAPGDAVVEFAWTDGDGPVEALSCVSVFDAKTVPLYADKANKIEFLPQGLDVLPRLGILCQKLTERLDVEIAGQQAKLAVPLPAFPAGTEVVGFMGKLTAGTRINDIPTEVQISDLAAWNEEVQAQLDSVHAQLLADPNKVIQRCKTLKISVQRLIDRVADAEKIIGTLAVKNLIETTIAADTARSAAVLAANTAFGNEPLTGVGGEPWRLMFEQARGFSAIAYPDVAFPVTGPDALCLLCQQPLQEEASNRLKRFDDFLKTALEDQAVKAETARTAAFNTIKSWNPSLPVDADTALASLEELLPTAKGITETVKAYLNAIASRKAAILEAFPNAENLEKTVALPASPSTVLAVAIISLDAMIVAQEAARTPEQRQLLEKSRSELAAKKLLHENLPAVLQRRLDLLRLIALRGARESCDTRTISLKNTELRRRYITEDFAKRVNKEKGRLNLDHIPLKVSDRSDKGTSYMAVDLEAEMSVRNADILSEGEFRALALACFLADINGIDGHAGIIIDDPVSSLDHLRTVAVAERLVEEAKTRQVIVFTHDLCLYHEVMLKAGADSVPLHPVWIRQTAEHGFGTVYEAEEPWTAKKVAKRIPHLDEVLQRIKKVADQKSEEYRYLAKDFYTDLRETWERLVEDLLLNGVVTRFQVGVKTLSLNAACVEDSDYQRVYFGMARASEYSGHDRTKARETDYPAPEQMQKELDEIRSYAKDLKTRGTTLSDRRKALEKPPKASVA